MVNVREAILNQLDAMKRTRYWLSCQVAPEIARTSVYQFLSGRTGTSIETLEKLLSIVGLGIVPVDSGHRSDTKAVSGRRRKRKQT